MAFTDTHAIVSRLRRGGFSEEQAEALTDVFRDHTRDLVTKADIADMATKSFVKTEIAELKADVFKWAVPLLLGQAALTAALVKLL